MADSKKKAVSTSVFARRAMLKLVGAGLVGMPVLSTSFSFAATQEGLSTALWRPAKMDVVTAIHMRRSYRDFTGEPVASEDLTTILGCGMAAPSARNLQPWHFVVLQEQKSLAKVSQSIPMTDFVAKAGCAILVSVDTRDQPGRHLAFVSSALCAQNMMLAATGLGYGSVWIELYPNEEYIEGWKSLAHLPSYITPLCILVIGRPRVPLPPVDRFDASKVHYETW